MIDFSSTNPFCVNCKDFSNLNKKFIGSGADGYVYDIGKNCILKISEYFSAYCKLSINQIDSLLKSIYYDDMGIFPIIYDWLVNTGKEECKCEKGYFIISEKLYFYNRSEELSEIIRNINANVLHSGVYNSYLNLDSNGQKFINNYINSGLMILDAHKDNFMVDRDHNVKIIDFDRIHKYNTKLYKEYFTYIGRS